MTLREQTEERERQTLSPFASLSSASQGRLRPITPCEIRTCYQRDVDRIVHSKSFRRLMHKTQVFLQPVHHPQGLLVVAEAPLHNLVKHPLPRVAEGGVAQVVTQGDGLGQVLVEA